MRKILYYMAIILYRLENIFLKLIPSQEENTIVLLRTDNIGDFLLWTDAAKEFRQKFSKEKILLICNSSTYSIAKMLPYWNEIIMIEEKKMLFNPIYRLCFFVRLSKRKFLSIYNCVYSHNYFIMDTIVHNLKAKDKIGYDGNYNNIKNILKGFLFSENKINSLTNKLLIRSKSYYTQMIKGNSGIVMELTRNADFIRKTINREFLSSLPKIDIKLKKQDFGLEDKQYMVLFIGASSMNRVWNIEKYASLIDNIEDKVVVCGGKSDENTIIKIQRLIHKDIINFVGKTTIIDLFSVIKNAKYIVTNDTSAGHIAPIMRTKSIILLPGNYIGRFHPYKVEKLDKEDEKYIPNVIYHSMDCFNCNNYCKYVKDHNTIWPCIDNIQLENVLHAIHKINNY